MAIEDKIEEIRQKPENVRMMYIFGSVTIIMSLIVILWIFSIRVDVRAVVNDVDTATALPDGQGQLQNLRDAINESGTAIDEAQAERDTLEASLRAEVEALDAQQQAQAEVQTQNQTTQPTQTEAQ